MTRVVCLALAMTSVAQDASAGNEPDYSGFNMILSKYYNPSKGIDYRGLKANDLASLNQLRQQMAKADVSKLDRKEQLAYWINLYNVSVIGIVVDHYPVNSIRDISTDPILRLNVFKKNRVPFGNGEISLDTIEHKKIREGFKDPRIHFAINCGARSCPPMPASAMTGATVDQQLDQQASDFLSGPMGVRIETNGTSLIIRTTKIMDWFEKDFVQWGGGVVPFIEKFVSGKKKGRLKQFRGRTKIDYDDYDWSLNDWRR